MDAGPEPTPGSGADRGRDEPDDRTVSFRSPSPASSPRARGGALCPGDDWGEELESFARNLVALGLVGEAELRGVLGRLPARPGDRSSLAQELVRAGTLTAYQAGAVLQKKTKGLVLGNYVILDKLGAGGGGMVFKARHRKLARVVALKILPPSITADPGAVLRFEREVKVAAQLSHPNIVGALDADEFQGLHFLVMDYVEGRDLGRVVARDGPLPLDRAIDLTIQASRGLQVAHGRGIIHRDIKPSNLIVDLGGTLKVLDMGLARITGANAAIDAEAMDAGLTQVGSIMGTIDFMPPEQAYDPKAADERSDVYSLGCTLYFLIAGQVPFGGGTFVQRVLAHRNLPVPSIANIPPALNGILHRMMAKDPAERPQSMAEVIAGLEAFRGGSHAADEVVAPAPKSEPGVSRRRSARILAASLLALALAAGLTGVYFATRPAEVAQVDVTPDAPHPPVPAQVDIPPHEPDLALRATSISKDVVEVPPLRAAQPPPPPEGPGRIFEFRGHSKSVQSVAVTRGGFAASGGFDATVRFWDVANHKEIAQQSEADRVFTVAFTTNGLVLSSGQGGRVQPWDPSGGRKRAGFAASKQWINSIACSPADPDLCATGGGDGTVRVWRLKEPPEQVVPFKHDGIVTVVAFLDARRILSGSRDKTVRLWDLETKTQEERINVDTGVYTLSASPDGRRVLIGGHGGALSLHELGKPGGAALKGHTADVMCCAFLTDDLAVSGDISGDRSEGALILWDLAEGQSKPRRTLKGAGHRGIAVLSDRRHVLTADEDGVVRLWNLTNDEPMVRQSPVPPR
jgi:WD40 repeat protein/tRNA A-37 threonylcarbamoyl transferase component Bud32